MKDFEDMTRKELLHALELVRAERDMWMRAAGAFSKEKLLTERRFLPQFVEGSL